MSLIMDSLRVCGILGQCLVHSLRIWKNVMMCGCVLDSLLFEEYNLLGYNAM
jgi:hypothetical protein